MYPWNPFTNPGWNWDIFDLVFPSASPSQIAGGEVNLIDPIGAAIATLLAASPNPGLSAGLAILPPRNLGPSLLSLSPKTCTGGARVLYTGNDTLLGNRGGFGNEVSLQTAAIIPSQFGGYNRLKPYANQISGWGWRSPSPNSAFTFQGLDVMGGASARQKQQRLNPGRFIIELYGASHDLGTMQVFIFLPSNVPCPTGTQATN